MAELPTDAKKMAEAPVPAAAAESSQKTINLDDCKRHTTEKDCWIVLSGKVYDVTEFLDEHPGGFDIVLAATGMALSTHASKVDMTSSDTRLKTCSLAIQ